MPSCARSPSAIARSARDDETILFWRRGLSLSGIALRAAMLDKVAKLGVGQRVCYA
jgi:ornithine cyclodeaminase